MSFGVPAKPGIAKDLIEANDISRKAAADLIDSILAKKICLSQPHKMLQANKVLSTYFYFCEVKLVEIVQFTKRKQPDESLKKRLWSA